MATARGERVGPFSVIRLPTALRAYVVAFSVFWCGGVGAGLVIALVHGSPAAIILVGMLAFGGTLAYRLFRMSVEMRDSELLVRNYFRTLRIQRVDVEGFRVGPTTAQPFSKAIHVLTRGDQIIPLDVTSRPYLFGRGSQVLERRLTDLKRWNEQR